MSRVIKADKSHATLQVNDSTETINPEFTDYWDK